MMSDLINALKSLDITPIGDVPFVRYEDVLRAVANHRPADEWCTDCSEYDHDKHCCPRFNRVIRTALDDSNTHNTLEALAQRWIPVTERMPKKHGESYLVTISDGAVYTTTLQWDANCKRWYLSFLNDGNILVDFFDDVVAWMPLPAPYGEDGDWDV